MALKNVGEVKHITITGTLYELNFHVNDKRREGYRIEAMSVLTKGEGNTLDTKYTVLYCFVRDNKDA